MFISPGPERSVIVFPLVTDLDSLHGVVLPVLRLVVVTALLHGVPDRIKPFLLGVAVLRVSFPSTLSFQAPARTCLPFHKVSTDYQRRHAAIAGTQPLTNSLSLPVWKGLVLQLILNDGQTPEALTCQLVSTHI